MTPPIRPQTAEEALEELLASAGRNAAPMAPADATAGLNPADYDAFSARFGNVKPVNPLVGAARSALSGRTVGLSERPVAAVRALLAGPSSASDFRQKYDSTRALGEQEMARFRTEMPILALGSELVGGSVGNALNLANSLATGMTKGADKIVKSNGIIGRTVKGAGVGAGMGAAAGVGYQGGEADKSIEQTVANALFGAGTGAAVGGALPLAGALGGVGADITGLRTLRRPLESGELPMNLANRPVEKNPLKGAFWSKDNMTNARRNLVNAAEGTLYPTQVGTMADMDWTQYVTDGGSSTVDDAVKSLAAVQSLTRGDGRVMDVGGDRGLRAMRGARSKGVEASGRMHKAFAEDRATLAEKLDDDVRTIMGSRTNVPKTVEAREAALRGQANASYGPLYSREVQLSDDVQQRIANDPQNLWSEFWESGRTSALREDPSRKISALFGKDVQQMPVEGGVFGLPGSTVKGNKMLRNPTVEDIDIMKRGMDVLGNDKMNAKYSQMKRDGSLLSNTKRDMIADADKSVPEYGTTRKAYGDAAERITAFRAPVEGVDNAFNSVSPIRTADTDSWTQFIDGLSDEARKEAQFGTAQALYRMIDDNASNALGKMGGSNNSRRLGRNIATTFRDNPEAAQKLASTANTRDALRKNANFIEGGSQTADKLMDIAGASVPGRIGQITYAPERAGFALLGEKGVSATKRALADEVATRGLLGAPEGIQYLKYLEELGPTLARRAAARNTGRARGIGAGIGARDAIKALFGSDEEY